MHDMLIKALQRDDLFDKSTTTTEDRNRYIGFLINLDHESSYPITDWDKNNSLSLLEMPDYLNGLLDEYRWMINFLTKHHGFVMPYYLFVESTAVRTMKEYFKIYIGDVSNRSKRMYLSWRKDNGLARQLLEYEGFSDIQLDAFLQTLQRFWGFDYGGGNCSAVRSDHDDCKLLKTMASTTHIMSTIAYVQTKPGEYMVVVGIAAMNARMPSVQADDESPDRDRSCQFLNFKVLPNDNNLKTILRESFFADGTDLTYERIMTDFIRETTSQLGMFDNNEGQSENLVVGLPSGKEWNDAKVQRNFKRIITNATKVKNVFFIRESRAALMYAKQYSTADTFNNGVMIIDVGGYSVDISIILALNANIAKESNLYDASIRLGGNEVDAALLESGLAAVQLNKNDVRYYNKAVFAARCAKESFYNRPDRNDAFPVELTGERPIQQIAVRDQLAEGSLLSTAKLRQLDGHEPETYEERFVRFVEETSASVITWIQDKGAKMPTQVILTGGASKMSPVIGYVRKGFENAGIQNLAITQQNTEIECDMSVAKGGVLYFRNAYLIARELADMRALLVFVVEKKIVPCIRELVVPVLVDSMYRICRNQCAEFRYVSLGTRNSATGFMTAVTDLAAQDKEQMQISSSVSAALTNINVSYVVDICIAFYKNLYGKTLDFSDLIKECTTNIKEYLLQKLPDMVASNTVQNRVTEVMLNYLYDKCWRGIRGADDEVGRGVWRRIHKLLNDSNTNLWNELYASYLQEVQKLLHSNRMGDGMGIPDMLMERFVHVAKRAIYC